MKYFLYARKSTDEDDKQLLSIDAQLAELREHARKESLTVAREFVESRTAKIPGRPVFNAMMREIERGQADGILAWHPDRLARNSVDGGRIIYALDTGALNALKFPAFWFENTPQGKFMLQIAFGQSKYYVDNLSENVKRGIRQKIRLGWFPSKPPIGYLNEPRLRTIVVDPVRAPLVRKLFEAYATDRYTIYGIRDLSERLGLWSRSGRPMFASRIPVILADVFYLGKFRLKGELFDGSHEPIIPRELFDQVQTILSRRSRKAVAHDPNDFSFLGLSHCASCGAAVTAERQKGHHYYRCTHKVGPCPEKKYLREEKLEARLRAGLESVSIDAEWADLMLAEIAKTHEAEKSARREQIQRGEQRLADLDARQARLVDLHLDGGISREDYLARREKLIHERATLAAQVAKMKEGGTGRLEPLAAFINDARQANYIARNGSRKELRDFHRKIGSNLFLTGRIDEVGSLRAPLLRRRTPRNPTRVSEPRRGGCAARAETESLVPAPSFASFFVFADSPAPPVSVAGFAQNPSAARVESSAPVLLADFPDPWRIIAETPKSLGWWAIEDSNLRPLPCQGSALTN